MKKIGICTVYTGFNYGSALQAFAVKVVLEELGYKSKILRLSGSFIRGKDVRIKKIISLLWNFLLRFNQTKKFIISYIFNNKIISHQTKEKFILFYEDKISALMLSNGELKKLAKSEEYLAFICGSDQIWNSATYYVDPFYYLTFAPPKKRIAFAPSFGRAYISKYNKKKITKYLAGISHISIREDSGSELIYELIRKRVPVLVDPTLVLDKEKWCKIFNLKSELKCDQYVLAYFLDEPSEKAKNVLKYYSEKDYNIISLPYKRNCTWCNECKDAGPIEFLTYLLNASVVCTDSFHGVAFSLNFEKEFCVFERNYGNLDNQSSRIISILDKVCLMERFNIVPSELDKKIDFSVCRKILEEERRKSKKYLVDSIGKAKKEWNYGRNNSKKW